MRKVLERNQSSTGLSCPPAGDDDGDIDSHAGGIGSGGARFNAYKSDSFACRITSPEAFDEARVLSALKDDVDRTLRDAGAQITETGSSGATSFYFAYALKNVRGRVQVSGTRIGSANYDVRADLNESGN